MGPDSADLDHHGIYAWKLVEPGAVMRRDERAARGDGRRHDDEIAGTAGRSRARHMSQEPGISPRHGFIVWLDWRYLKEDFHEVLSRGSLALRCEFPSGEQFCNGDRRDHQIVVAANEAAAIVFLSVAMSTPVWRICRVATQKIPGEPIRVRQPHPVRTLHRCPSRA